MNKAMEVLKDLYTNTTEGKRFIKESRRELRRLDKLSQLGKLYVKKYYPGKFK
jgi:hypothetical protein